MTDTNSKSLTPKVKKIESTQTGHVSMKPQLKSENSIAFSPDALEEIIRDGLHFKMAPYLEKKGSYEIKAWRVQEGNRERIGCKIVFKEKSK